MNKPIEDVDERIIAESHFLEEILAEPPRWIVRWGEAWVLIFLLTLLLGAALIRYPDRLTAEAVVTTTSPPVEIKAPLSGHIENLFVNDLKPVNKHDVLLTIGDDYDWEEVLFVEKLLLQGLHRLDTADLNRLFATELNLGPLQTSLQQAHVAYQNFLLEMSLQPAFQQQIATGEELRQIELLIAEKRGQQGILAQMLSLYQKDYDRHKLLHQKEAIADAELEAKENTWLDARRQVQAMAADIQQHQLAKARLEKEVMLFEHRHLLEAQKLQQELYVSLQELKTELISWKDRYIIMAPSSGKASFFSPLNEQQFIEQGEVLLHIIPDDESAIQAKLLVPTTNFGKVAIGQKVRLSLHNYPEKEFGRVEGKISSISSMPRDSYYQVMVSFPAGLNTSYGIKIPFSQNLTGQAEIITQDISLLNRLIHILRF
jgi:multidrug resistance efflux pump